MKVDPELFKKYDVSGPRYTSYPTALQFSDRFDIKDYLWHVEQSNQDPVPKSLSLYIHIPFCESLCYYCGCHKFITQSRDKVDHYLHALCNEIILQAKLFDPDREVKQLHIGGGTPTYLTVSDIQKIMLLIADHFNFISSQWSDISIEIDPRVTSIAYIKKLVAIGFNRMSFGVQDFDRDVQLAINRLQDKEHTLSLISAAKEAGVKSVSVDLVYGLPKQSLGRFAKTLEAIVEVRPGRVSLYNYAHMPELIKSQRLIPSEALPSVEEKLLLLNLAIETLLDAGYRHIGMDHFALPADSLSHSVDSGRLHRNFQGYSTHGDCDVLGFGVSAISRIRDGYSQNHKSLKTYQNQLQHQNLPVKRGYSLSADDQIRSAIIQQIMCSQIINFKSFGDIYRIVFKQYFQHELQQLTPMVEDELIVLSEKELKITKKGELVRRNIAMVFDAYLTANTHGDNLVRFSKVL